MPSQIHDLSIPGLHAINDIVDGYSIKDLTHLILIEELIAQSPRSDCFRGVLYDEWGIRQGQVVVKWMRGQHLNGPKGNEARVRLRREIATSAGMDHPNVVTLLGLVRENGNFVPVSPQFRSFGLVFPYIEHDLLSYLSENSTEADRVAFEVAKALQYLHSKHVVHSDMKHDNIRIASDGTVKVIDFGISHIVNIEGFDTDYGGNPQFTAPEQYSHDIGDPSLQIPTYASDIFSLGILLYQIFDPSSRYPYGPMHRNQLPRLAMSVHEGRRPNRTERHSDSIWGLMCACWRGEIDQRPHIEEVVDRLRA